MGIWLEIIIKKSLIKKSIKLIMKMLYNNIAAYSTDWAKD
jgi:hypothetical protein